MFCSQIRQVGISTKVQTWFQELTKNPEEFGGVHLPDLTVITPVFDSEGEEIIFWAASRGHHADVSPLYTSSHHPD